MSNRIRSIKPEWLDDEKMALASSDARALSVALVLLADDFGNGRANRIQLQGRIFPGKPIETLDNALKELSGWYVKLYEDDGQTYFSILNWDKHQKVDKPGKPKVPFPPWHPSCATQSSAPPSTPALPPEVAATNPESVENIREDSRGFAKALGDPENVRASRDPFPSLSPSDSGLLDQDLPDRSGSPRALDREPSQVGADSAVFPMARSKPPDPMGDHYADKTPTKDRRVCKLYDGFNTKYGYHGKKFRGNNDLDAQILLEAIHSEGEKACWLVLQHCHEDGMVNGKADERGQKHETIKYIFGNRDAFSRILRLAVSKTRVTESITARIKRLSEAG